MGGWNHRVVRHRTNESKDSDWMYGIYEVFYDEDNAPIGYSKASAIHTKLDDGEPIESLRLQVEWMMEATEKPILNHPDDFTGEIE